MLVARLLLFTSFVMGFSLSLAHGADGDLRLRVARKLAEKGQLTQALQEVRLYLAESPESSDGYALNGQLLQQLGKSDEAADSYRQAIAKNPHNQTALDALASLAPQSGAQGTNPPESIDDKDEADPKDGQSGNDDPKYRDEDFLAAIKAYREGRKPEAQVFLRKVLGRYPGHPGAYYLGGVIRYEDGEMGKASFNFKRSFNYPERGHNAHFYMGRIYQKGGKNKDAIREYADYIRLTPSQEGRERAKKLLEELQAVVGKEEEPIQARASVEKKKAAAEPAIPEAKSPLEAGGVHEGAVPVQTAVRQYSLEDGFLFLIPDSLSGASRKMTQAHAYYRRNRLQAAVQALKEVIRDYPGTENAEVARLDLAAIYLKLELWAEARNQLEGFISGLQETSRRYAPLAYYLLGRGHLGEGNSEAAHQAERYFLKVETGLPFAPSAAEVAWQLALAGELQDDLANRAGYYAKALALQPGGFRQIYLELHSGLHEAQYGKAAAAAGHFQKAMALCQKGPSDTAALPLCVEAEVRRADMAFRQKDWKTALGLYQGFLKSHPQAQDSPWAQYQIGNAHKAQGSYEQALQDYARVIDNFPDSYWAAQANWQREDTIWQKEFSEVLN